MGHCPDSLFLALVTLIQALLEEIKHFKVLESAPLFNKASEAVNLGPIMRLLRSILGKCPALFSNSVLMLQLFLCLFDMEPTCWHAKCKHTVYSLTDFKVLPPQFQCDCEKKPGVETQ